MVIRHFRLPSKYCLRGPIVYDLASVITDGSYEIDFRGRGTILVLIQYMEKNFGKGKHI